MIIKHNIPALRTANHLQRANQKSSQSMIKISSGLRIAGAADDAAGLAISEKMRAQIRGLQQAQKNIQDGISLLQVGDGALSEIQQSLQRMRELSVQAANGTLTNDDRDEIQKEVSQLNVGIKSVVGNTEFNTQKLFTVDIPFSVEWDPIQTSAAGNFQAITTNGEMFIAVTSEGEILLSLDGGDWEEEANLSRILTNVYWDGANFFVTGERQTVAYSSDGKDWNIGIDGGSHYFFHIAKNGETYMATGNAGRAYSDDGVNWIYQDVNVNQASEGLISNGTEFVWLQASQVKTSTDGVNWSTVFDFSPTFNVGEPDIAYNGETYVVTNVNGRTFTSQDLVNWTEGKTITDRVQDVKWESGQFIAVSQGEYNDGKSYISLSRDGVNWTSSTIESSSIQSVSSMGDDFIAVGTSGQVYKGSRGDASKSLVLQVDATNSHFEINLPNVNLILENLYSVSVNTTANANKAIQTIDRAIKAISSERSKFGAYQNALEHIYNNVQNYELNITAAESRIRDVDLAKEIMVQTKNSILSQSAQAMLAQSNQHPRNVLQLLN